MCGILRFIALICWAAVVFACGGYAVRHGGNAVVAGGVELLVLVLGVVAILLTPAWGRSVDRDRESARY